MKHIGTRELREGLADHLKSEEPMIIERHGKVLGIYTPVNRERLAVALEDFDAAVEAIAHDTGMTRDEIADAFAIKREGHGTRD